MWKLQTPKRNVKVTQSLWRVKGQYIINAERYYELDPMTAPVVLEIFTRYADGQTVAEISNVPKL
ncbi:MAG TPA: hypothetical protein DEQ02_07920 [Ruminococcaceae bacterium]|nr:hypothetical protein [Oscillospiraceae bacterium]